jgi:hypothetical protein
MQMHAVHALGVHETDNEPVRTALDALAVDIDHMSRLYSSDSLWEHPEPGETESMLFRLHARVRAIAQLAEVIQRGEWSEAAKDGEAVPS